MNQEKIGRLICSLRKEKRLTQRQLAEQLNISDKTVSKWERGLGCPDISLLSALSGVFGVHLENLLEGNLDSNRTSGDHMKKLKFYVCTQCGNLLTATNEAAIFCCGKKLEALLPVKAKEDERLRVEVIENEYFVSSDHEMTKAHYISFVALLTGDSLMLRRQYPEWDLQTRIPCFGHGLLLWRCSQHGLFYQVI